MLDGKRHMLTIPIQRPHIKPIRDARFANEAWEKKHLETIARAYGNSLYFDFYYPLLKEIIYGRHCSLEELNIELTNFIAFCLGITTTIVDSANWHFNGDAVDMIIQMCQAVDADRYLSNDGAKDYLKTPEEERLQEAGIWHTWLQGWKDPDPEPLSAIHHLFAVGPDAARLIQ